MAKEKLKTRLKKITAVEWAISSIGILVFLFTVVYILYSAVFNNANPPDIRINLISVDKSGNDFLMTIEAVNMGDLSVEGLEVEAILYGEGGEIEKGSTTFDYVPGQSKRKGGIFFKHNPLDYKMELNPLGFEEP